MTELVFRISRWRDLHVKRVPDPEDIARGVLVEFRAWRTTQNGEPARPTASAIHLPPHMVTPIFKAAQTLAAPPA